MAADNKAKDKEKEPEAAETAEKPKSKMLLIIIIALVVVLVGGGAAAFFMLSGGDKDKKEGEAEESEEAAHAPAIYFDMKPPFIVNYQVNGRQRYVQVSLSVMTRKQAAVDVIQKHMPLIRNNLVMMFSAQDFEVLRTPEGKESVRQAALEDIQKIVTEETGEPGVEQVLFTNFVMQ